MWAIAAGRLISEALSNGELQPTFNGEHAVMLHGGAKLTLSRGYGDALRSRLVADW